MNLLFVISLGKLLNYAWGWELLTKAKEALSHIVFMSGTDRVHSLSMSSFQAMNMNSDVNIRNGFYNFFKSHTAPSYIPNSSCTDGTLTRLYFIYMPILFNEYIRIHVLIKPRNCSLHCINYYTPARHPWYRSGLGSHRLYGSWIANPEHRSFFTLHHCWSPTLQYLCYEYWTKYLFQTRDYWNLGLHKFNVICNICVLHILLTLKCLWFRRVMVWYVGLSSSGFMDAGNGSEANR